jgi:glucose/arabinose dehydrogenase
MPSQEKFRYTVISFAALIGLFAFMLCSYTFSAARAQEGITPHMVQNQSLFEIQRVFSGINSSTNMAFLGPNDILALEKVTGQVDRIVNGQMLDEPLLDVNSYFQDGLIGLDVSKNQNGSTYVFLYFNEAPKKYGADIDDPQEADKVNSTLGYVREGDRLYRYEFLDNNLVNPKLLIDLRASQSNNYMDVQHHGGEVLVGPDESVYVIVGDLDGWKYDEKTKAQNYKDGKEPDGRAGVLRVTQDGKPVGNGILGDTYPLNLYYAYGIRNSFGMDFDPVTGNLWETENGPEFGDEINLVLPGFNGGADVVLGMSSENDELENLVDFNGKGKYRDPEFVWSIPVAPTAIKFFNSDKFGSEFENDMFVADSNHGNIYHFELNNERTALDLVPPLKDKREDKPIESKNLVFATGFGGITDLQVGPDGYLYVLAGDSIYRIVPNA